MRNKGFTLIELLAVIVIIGALVAIAVPSVIYVSKNLKTKMYCTKLETIEEAAKLYGQDNITTLTGTCAAISKTNCISTTISNLLTANYLESDNSSNQILDPRNKTSLNAKTVYIYKENNRVYARIVDAACD